MVGLGGGLIFSPLFVIVGFAKTQAASASLFLNLIAAGSLGDLGTLLPIAIAMVLFNKASALGLFLSNGVYYLVSGVYFGITVPVQPMKVIGAYAIATAMSPDQILASSLLMGVFLLIVGLTGAIDIVRKFIPNSVIRGVQLSTGALLIAGGVKFMIGTSKYQALQQAVVPHLSAQSIGALPISLVFGTVAAIVTLLLLDNKKFPVGLIVVVVGLAAGLAFGARFGMSSSGFGFNLPELLPFGFPGKADFTFALFALVLPQLPMTLGNAVLACTDLSKEYFGDRSAKVTNRKVCVTMALANFSVFHCEGCLCATGLEGWPHIIAPGREPPGPK
jgi:SulP family sulfate permease